MRNAERILAALTVLLILSGTLFGCAGKKSATWITYKDTAISEASYRFWFSEIKNNFVSSYSDITDTLECWNGKTTDADGKTVTRGEYVELYVQQYAKNMAVELQLFSDYNLKLTDEDTKKVDDYLNEVIYYRYSDSKKAFSSALRSVYGITLEELRETLLYESRVAKVEDYLFGENGVMAPTDGEFEEYYRARYVHILPIVIGTESAYTLDDRGEIVKDASGLPVYRALTEEEKQAKIKTADAVMQFLSDGEDFSEIALKYGDRTVSYNENGYYFSSDDAYSLALQSGLSLPTGIFSQEIGSVARYDLDGAIVIVKRIDLADGAYRSSALSEQFSTMREHIVTQKNRKLIEPMLAEVRVKDELYAVKTVDVKKGIL